MSLALAPAIAQATYHYDYTGNPFEVTSSAFDPGSGTWVSSTSEMAVSASFDSATALVAGSGLASVPTFSLTSFDPSSPVSDTLTYPYVFPPGYPYPPDNPSVTGVLQIGAVDASGRPTAWNLSIDFEFRTPTAHLQSSVIATSDIVDSISGGYEGYTSYAGSGSGQPGTWAVSVSAVPEAPAGMLLLFGLAAGAAKSGHARKKPLHLCKGLIRQAVLWLPDLGSNQGPTD